MSSRVQAWVWWLLPLLVARALMPVGFMAQAVDGQLQIVFCTAGYSQVQDDHHGQSTSPSHDQSSDKSQNDFSCPFAQAAAAPLLDLPNGAIIAFIATAEILPPAESPYSAAGPPRFIATRGPPTQA